jgi:hypothetical protein
MSYPELSIRRCWVVAGIVEDGAEWDVGTAEISRNPQFIDALFDEAGLAIRRDTEYWRAAVTLLQYGEWAKVCDLLTRPGDLIEAAANEMLVRSSAIYRENDGWWYRE